MTVDIALGAGCVILPNGTAIDANEVLSVHARYGGGGVIDQPHAWVQLRGSDPHAWVSLFTTRWDNPDGLNAVETVAQQFATAFRKAQTGEAVTIPAWHTATPAADPVNQGLILNDGGR